MRQLAFIPLAFFFVASSFLSGQNSVSARGNSATATFSARSFAIMPVTGAPYCADEVSEHRQTLVDGTHIIQTDTRRRVCRDSAGRIRTERSLFGGPARHGLINPVATMKVIEIQDPVGGFTYTLDTQNKVAHRVKLAESPNPDRPRLARTGKAEPPPPPGANSSAETSQRPQFSTEPLDSKTINGVQVVGTLNKVVYPVDWEGNDKPITVTTETWTSPVMQLTILSTNSDPRSGDHINRLDNLTPTEPDPGMFQVPSDYQVVDETDTFKIQYTAQ